MFSLRTFSWRRGTASEEFTLMYSALQLTDNFGCLKFVVYVCDSVLPIWSHHFFSRSWLQSPPPTPLPHSLLLRRPQSLRICPLHVSGLKDSWCVCCSGIKRGCSLVVWGCDVSECKGSPGSEMTLTPFREKILRRDSCAEFVITSNEKQSQSDWEREVLLGTQPPHKGLEALRWTTEPCVLRTCQVAPKLWIPPCLSPWRL